MTIQFLPPNPEQKQSLDELEKLLAILSQPVSKELKQNIRFVKRFTKALFLAGKSYKPSIDRPKLVHEIRGFDNPEIPSIKTAQMPEINLPKLQAPPIAPRPPQAPRPISNIEEPLIIPSQGFTAPELIQEAPQTVIENNILKFNIIEPRMEPTDWKIFSMVKRNLKEKILSSPDILQNQNFLVEEIKKTCKELNIKYSDSYLQKISYYLTKYQKGYGKIDPLIKDRDITEITCNSYNDLQVKYKGSMLKTDISFDSNEELDNFLLNLAEKSNKAFSESNPELTFNLNGLIIQVFYNPIMGSRFTIRKQ